jgi:hypothetical protein
MQAHTPSNHTPPADHLDDAKLHCCASAVTPRCRELCTEVCTFFVLLILLRIGENAFVRGSLFAVLILCILRKEKKKTKSAIMKMNILGPSSTRIKKQ